MQVYKHPSTGKTLKFDLSKTSEPTDQDPPEIISSGGDITCCAELPTIDSDDLVGYKFVRKFDEIPQ